MNECRTVEDVSIMALRYRFEPGSSVHKTYSETSLQSKSVSAINFCQAISLAYK
jgi:hypothetical protein